MAKSQEFDQDIWLGALASDSHCAGWGPVWLTILPYSTGTANPWTVNLPFFLLHHPHVHHSTYQVTGFHDTISSPRIKWKQMDRGPRQFPHVWISGGTLFPICFYLGNGAKEWGMKPVGILSTTFGMRRFLLFRTHPRASHRSTAPVGIRSASCGYLHPDTKGYRETQWSVL